MDEFDYRQAFSRNIGWLTQKEQLILKNKKIAIAGMGGVGGIHLLTLCRLGIERFHIADPDHFELVNFNRQAGATASTLGQSKTDVLVRMAKDINPNVVIDVFDKVTADSVQDFLSDVDLYVDGIDFFAVDGRECLFNECHKKKIPAITAAPIGMGVNYLIFNDEGMSFEDYFQWQGKTETEKLINFMIGLAPKPYHLSYIVDKSTIDLAKHKGPSTGMACMLCAGVTGVQALKILLQREKIYSAPYFHQFDAYLGKFKRGYLWNGNKNPFQQLKSFFIKRIMKANNPSHEEAKKTLSLIEKIIDIARWSPSGDNTQPWRFQILNNESFLIHIHHDIPNDIYDFANKPTLLSIGCLMECITLSANQEKKKALWAFESPHSLRVNLIEATTTNDPLHLVDFIRYRSVNRGHYQNKIPPDTIFEKLSLMLDKNITLKTFTSSDIKKQFIRLNMLGTQIRLLLKSAHDVHEKVIRWNDNDTSFGIPVKATGLSALTRLFFKPLFSHWTIMAFVNRYLGGALFASIELDYLPGINSAGFFTVETEKSMDGMTDQEWIEAGMNIQRIWLALTQQNIVMQPCYISIIISYYARHNISITNNTSLIKKIKQLTAQYQKMGLSDKTLFIARFGYPKNPQNSIRSTRLTLEELMHHESPH